jgi:outer membrane protein assembly factor BamB
MAKIVRALVVGALAMVTAGCWPVPGQNADRTGYNPAETELASWTVADMHEVWRWTGSANMTGPVLSRDGLHVLGDCRATTLDPATGEVQWSAPLGDERLFCSAPANFQESEPYVTVDGERVVGSAVGSAIRAPGYLQVGFSTRAFDVATGASTDLAGVDFVLAERGTRLVSFTEAMVAPLTTSKWLSLANVDTGEERSLRLSIQISQSPLAIPEVTLGTDSLYHAGVGILATEPGDSAQGFAVRAFSLDERRPGCGPVPTVGPGGPSTGPYEVECPLWVTPVDGTPTAPVLSPDHSTLYVRTSAGTLYALDAATGEVLWTGTGLGDAGRIVWSREMVYVPTGDGRIVAFIAQGCDAATCLPYWSYPTGTSERVSDLAVAGTVLYATAGQTAYAFEAGGCRSMVCSPLWSGPGTGSPVVSDGHLYVRSPSGTDLIAYGLD